MNSTDVANQLLDFERSITEAAAEAHGDWPGRPMLGFDTETTGVDTKTARIVTIALTLSRNGEDTTLQLMLDPGIEIPEGATAVHGITTEVAREQGLDPKRWIEPVAMVLASALNQGVPVVAFNAQYDFQILDAELRRHADRPFTDLTNSGDLLGVVDPFVLDRGLDRFRKGKRTLAAVSQVYGVTQVGTAHTADADAAMAVKVARAVVKRHPHIGLMPLELLLELQAAYYYTWATGYNAWLSRQGRKANVSTQWPGL